MKTRERGGAPGASGVSRRALIGAAVAAGGAAGGAARAARPPAAGRAKTADGRWTRIRRVVTSEDARGRAVLLADGEPTNSFELGGTRVSRLWEIPGLPARIPLGDDAGATAGNAYRPDFTGTSFYVCEIPGGERAPQIALHRVSTVDYMAILSGHLVYRIDDREIELGPGDTIVQGGTNHTWINRWDEPCLLLFVVVTARAAGAGAPAPVAGTRGQR
jgi:mannose-6-phosphate isomerase-like protein (cupin superfamily)